jgi:hypothetical protein
MTTIKTQGSHETVKVQAKDNDGRTNSQSAAKHSQHTINQKTAAKDSQNTTNHESLGS